MVVFMVRWSCALKSTSTWRAGTSSACRTCSRSGPRASARLVTKTGTVGRHAPTPGLRHSISKTVPGHATNSFSRSAASAIPEAVAGGRAQPRQRKAVAAGGRHRLLHPSVPGPRREQRVLDAPLAHAQAQRLTGSRRALPGQPRGQCQADPSSESLRLAHGTNRLWGRDLRSCWARKRAAAGLC